MDYYLPNLTKNLMDKNVEVLGPVKLLRLSC